MNRIRKGDLVVVLVGRDKGKQGEVLQVMPLEGRIIVQGVNITKRHRRPTSRSSGGINEAEASIHVSNVAHLDPKNKQPTKVGFKILEDGRKVRFARLSGEIIDG